MSLLLIITVALLGSAAVLGLAAYLLFAKTGDMSNWEILGALAGIVAFGCLIGGIVEPVATLTERAYGRVDCRGYGQRTGRSVRFVVTNSLDSGTCMTPDGSGRWVSTDNLRIMLRGQR